MNRKYLLLFHLLRLFFRRTEAFIIVYFGYWYFIIICLYTRFSSYSKSIFFLNTILSQEYRVKVNIYICVCFIIIFKEHILPNFLEGSIKETWSNISFLILLIPPLFFNKKMQTKSRFSVSTGTLRLVRFVYIQV